MSTHVGGVNFFFEVVYGDQKIKQCKKDKRKDNGFGSKTRFSHSDSRRVETKPASQAGSQALTD